MPLGLSDLLDSDMEATNYVHENSLISTASDEAQMAGRKAAVVKRVKKRKCVTMPKRKPVVRPQSNHLGERDAPTASRKRKAMVEDVDENSFIEVQPRTDIKKQHNHDHRDIRSKPRGRSKTKKPIALEEGDDDDDDEEEEEEVVERVQSNFAPVKAGRPIPRPQLVTESGSARKKMRAEVTEHARNHASSETSKSDSELRRRLGEITRKCEAIDLKYRKLKDVGIHEATNNVERMRKQCENITEASNRLVTSLKKELAAQALLVAESKKHEQCAQKYEEEVKRLQTENRDAASQLTTAHQEIKALQVKLATLKASAADFKVPAPATKSASTQKTLIVASGNDVAQIAQLKVDLYGDLTGLIVRSVKKTEEGDTYDCIQTGRNGSKYSCHG